MRAPDAQLRAGHLPADLIPPGVDPRSVVIVQAPQREYLAPTCAVLAMMGGAAGVAVVVCEVIEATTHLVTALAAVVPTAGVGGITLALRRSK